MKQIPSSSNKGPRAQAVTNAPVVRTPAAAAVSPASAVRSAPMDPIVRAFHERYYNNNVWGRTHWLGNVTLKCPLDLWIYQELIHEIKPELIVEAGTYAGGSAMFLASTCDAVGKGKVITIDIGAAAQPAHPRIEYHTSSSTNPVLVDYIRGEAKRLDGPVLVILDSDHTKHHVYNELVAYADIVTPGSYIVVEDTNINGHPVAVGWGEGPHEAVEAFLSVRPNFSRDMAREKFEMTFNPGGYLRRNS